MSEIRSMKATKEYRDGWEAIWGSKNSYKVDQETLDTLKELPQPPLEKNIKVIYIKP